MNVKDRVVSAKHTLTGSGLAKAVGKATSHEVIGPKKKHVDYILSALETDNVSIPDTADMLFERCTDSSWVVVFKSLVTFHHLMANGNERFIQYIASRSATWMLGSFLDKSGVQGYDMSHIIRKYAAYLMEKAYSYRTMGFDFCRISRGKDNGVLRNMDTLKLLKALPAIQTQLDALIATEISSNDLTNGVITAAFMLLFKGLIRLFACYNDGIINLLEKYFEMKKNDCKASLEIYKKFLARMDKVSEFLKSAEDAGIDKGDIPDLSKAPNSLLEALETHFQCLERGKGAALPSKPVTLPAFNVEQWYSKNEKWMENGVKSSPPKAADDSEDFVQQQQKLLEMFQKHKEQQPSPKTQRVPDVIPSPKPSIRSSQPQAQATAFDSETTTTTSSSKPSDDLLLLNPTATTFIPSMSFGNQMPAFGTQNTNDLFSLNTAPPADFNNPFLQSNHSSSVPNLFDDILTPETNAKNSTPSPKEGQDGRLTGDLNRGLERVALSLDGLNINPGTFKVNTSKGHQWNSSTQSTVKTGGANYQMAGVAKSTLPPAGFNPMAQPRFPPYAVQAQPYYGMQQPAGYPAMSPQPMVYGNLGYNQRLANPMNANDPFK